MPRLLPPTSQFTGFQFQYLSAIAQAINSIPNFSYFTQQTPNGTVLGQDGDFAIYVGSASTVSKIWVNQSQASTVPTTTGWSLVGTNIVTQTIGANTFQSLSASSSVFTTTTLVDSRPNLIGGDIVVTLPTVSSYGTGRTVYVHHVDNGSGFQTFIQPNGGETISPVVSSLTLGAPAGAFGLTSGTTNWFLTSQSSL